MPNKPFDFFFASYITIIGKMDASYILGRTATLFDRDLAREEEAISSAVRHGRFLVYGGAGSIGKEVVRQIFKRNPAVLHVIDISENNLVELVRELRSSVGYIDGETKFLPLDMSSLECTAFVHSQPPYDFVLNLAAMKHVRSEKDEYSLMRMIKVNVLDTRATLNLAISTGTPKYFAVSTDKAKRPANLMGATKRIMEDILFADFEKTSVSSARFANVAFSDGSLLHGFTQRLLKRQPIVAPSDIRRYFITGEESGLFCLAAAITGQAREIFFPKLAREVDLLTFSDIAVRFLKTHGFEPYEVASEGEARDSIQKLMSSGRWPCFFFNTDTSGEKPVEEFCSESDIVNWNRFRDIGVISVPIQDTVEVKRAHHFLDEISALRSLGKWTKSELVALIQEACPELEHIDTGKFLDEKM